ncbi:MAG: hypothetical protein M3430_08795 [Acidobacteriota bacterium]|nr:hypothetical protein [Acidobacteriota bacterium]
MPGVKIYRADEGRDEKLPVAIRDRGLSTRKAFGRVIHRADSVIEQIPGASGFNQRADGVSEIRRRVLMLALEKRIYDRAARVLMSGGEAAHTFNLIEVRAGGYCQWPPRPRGQMVFNFGEVLRQRIGLCLEDVTGQQHY